MPGGTRDFHGPRTAAASPDRGVDAVRAFKTKREVTSSRGCNHVAPTYLNRTPGSFFVACKHHNHAGIFQRAHVCKSFQGVENNNIAALHIRAAVAVSFVALATEAFALKHRVNVAEQEDSLATPARA